MTLEIVFWILMLIWLVWGGVGNWPAQGAPANRIAIGGHLLLFFIILVLGWAEFGAPISGHGGR